ncbi:hypothetical protein ACFL54_09955 [Planctomycetota bacterium]
MKLLAKSVKMSLSILNDDNYYGEPPKGSYDDPWMDSHALEKLYEKYFADLFAHLLSTYHFKTILGDRTVIINHHPTKNKRYIYFQDEDIDQFSLTIVDGAEECGDFGYEILTPLFKILTTIEPGKKDFLAETGSNFGTMYGLADNCLSNLLITPDTYNSTLDLKKGEYSGPGVFTVEIPVRLFVKELIRFSEDFLDLMISKHEVAKKYFSGLSSKLDQLKAAYRDNIWAN